MKLRILIITLLALYSSSSFSKDGVLFDIKSFCRSSMEEAKSKLPIELKYFEIESIETKYGHEETWTLKDQKKLQSLGLKTIQIQIQNDKVQMVWFIDIGTEKEKAKIFATNLNRAGLEASELTKVMSEYRVKSDKGFPIRIFGEESDYFECVEYHAGH